MTGWVSAGATSESAWGRYQGSASTPYEVVVDLRPPPRSTCSCPSRKFPCRHAVALLGLLSEQELPHAPPPAYAERWLGQRAEPPTRSIEVADPEAVAKRAAARMLRVRTGLEELDRWLGDQVRSGLAGIERVGYAHFESVAARMVDA